MYSPDGGYKNYEQSERWSDKWNAMDYGRDFDFTRPFFEQFNEILKDIPDMALIQDNNENSQFTNDCFQSKNCYYLFTSNTNQDCCYWDSVFWCKDTLDSLWVLASEKCFDVIKSNKCFWCFYWLNLTDCRDCFYCTDCNGCKDCLFCAEIENKSYSILNKQYSKEEYETIFEQLKNDNSKIEDMKLKYKELLKTIPKRNITTIWGENLIWDQLENSKNCTICFDSFNITDSKFLYSVWQVSDGYDCTITWTLDRTNYRIYEWLSVPWVNDSICNISCRFGNNIYYSRNCFYSSSLFSCVWLRDKQYCILNKQYTKEEYETLVPKIIEHMKSTWERWEFFPAWISPFGYNETVANEYFPLSREQAIAKWYKRQDKEYPINVPDWIELIKWQDLPKDINDVSDEILKKAVVCEINSKPFRIVKPELEFYRKHNLPLPCKHPDVRHLERMRKRAPRQLYLRTCDNCGKQVISVYPQNNEFKVYCENCYNKQIY